MEGQSAVQTVPSIEVFYSVHTLAKTLETVRGRDYVSILKLKRKNF
jgi:hypothetical protein